jgi:hypothetical protein
MAAEGTEVSDKNSPALGVFSLVMGLLACAGVSAIWLVSTSALDMPGWLRIVSGWTFPIGALGAIVLGVIARARRAGAGLSTIGFVLAGVSVIEFGVMIAANPY